MNAADVAISQHAMERYMQRRRTTPEHAEAGIRRLLAKAETKHAPIRLTHGGAARRYSVGGFTLVLSADDSSLITLWRNG